jgi:hypothetical protein
MCNSRHDHVCESTYRQDVGWRDDLQDRLNPRSRGGCASQPACPGCAAQRTVQTIDRALYCPTCGHVWTADVTHAWRTFVLVNDKH